MFLIACTDWDLWFTIFFSLGVQVDNRNSSAAKRARTDGMIVFVFLLYNLCVLFFFHVAFYSTFFHDMNGIGSILIYRFRWDLVSFTKTCMLEFPLAKIENNDTLDSRIVVGLKILNSGCPKF